MKNILAIITLCFIVASCTKDPDTPPDTFLTGSGVFILNEGNFMWGNGSLSFYSYDSAKVYNDLFQSTNGWPLGDVPNSISIYDDKAYIVVNNSGKIEVVNINTLESFTTIEGLNSPRNITIINDNKAYITSIYSDSIAVINPAYDTISDYINIRRSSEAIVTSGDKAFISHWMGGNEVMVINTVNNEVVDSIEVGIEPESMVLDKNNILWVLCNGGWARENFAKLLGINTINHQVEKEFIFPTILVSPSCLRIDGKGEILYYLENGVRQMNIDDPALPSTTFIAESDCYFYKMGIDPVNSNIFITDAVDYQQQGFVLYYDKDGTFVSEQTTGIIPGFINFKIE